MMSIGARSTLLYLRETHMVWKKLSRQNIVYNHTIFRSLSQAVSYEAKKAEAKRYIDAMSEGTSPPPSLSQSSVAPLIHQKFTGRKRFYKHVGIELVPAHDDKHHHTPLTQSSNKAHEYRLTLDGRVLRTPGRNPLHFTSKLLALAVAAEWDLQASDRRGLEPITMPLTTLASTAIDQILVNREDVLHTCMKYLPTDSALFFTDENDRILLGKQRKYLSPVLRHLNRSMGVSLNPTTQVSSRIQHEPETIATFRSVLEKMDHFQLACVQSVVMECKSIVLAFAYLSGYLNLEQTKIASRLEEEFQVEIWGVVEGGHDMDRLNNSVNLAAASTFFSLLQGSNALKQQMFMLAQEEDEDEEGDNEEKEVEKSTRKK